MTAPGAAARAGFKIQWHVTGLCNLSCRHCYDAGDFTEPDFHDLLGVYEKIREFFIGFHAGTGGKTCGHLSLTGGEPFARAGFFDLLERAAKDRPLFRFSILTNGTLVTASLAARLKTLAPSHVQVSLDGPEEIHDSIRGKGSYRKAVEGAKHLIRENIPVIFSFTLHRQNKEAFPQVVRLARNLGVQSVWSDRLVPVGRPVENGLEPVNFNELRDFFRRMVRERQAAGRAFISKTRVSMHRALQFHEGGGKPYRCQAGNRLLAVDPGGTVLPCRRLPVPVGNVKDDSLARIHRESEFLIRLRHVDSIPEECRACFYSKLCRGGLRCLAHAVYGDPFHKDPDCPGTWG